MYMKAVRKMNVRTPPVINDNVWASARYFDFYRRDRRATKAQTSLRICAVSPDPSLLACMHKSIYMLNSSFKRYVSMGVNARCLRIQFIG